MGNCKPTYLLSLDTATHMAALDPKTGLSYQLHHIGQRQDSTLAILTEAEHMQGGNNLIWHLWEGESQIDRVAFAAQRQSFWKSAAKLLVEEAI